MYVLKPKKAGLAKSHQLAFKGVVYVNGDEVPMTKAEYQEEAPEIQRLLVPWKAKARSKVLPGGASVLVDKPTGPRCVEQTKAKKPCKRKPAEGNIRCSVHEKAFAASMAEADG